MRKTFLGLVVALGLVGLWLAQPRAQPAQVGPANAILCNAAPQVAIGTSGVTQIVAAVANQLIVVCGWHVTNSATAGTFQLSYGTGTNCATNNTVLTPAFTVTSTAPATDHIDFALLQAPKGVALCFNPSVATIAALVYTAQF